MPKLIVQNLKNAEIEVKQGQVLLNAIQASGYDWMHACGAKGRCTTCRIVILSGMEYLGSLTASEQRYHSKQRLKDNERLACQCIMNEGEVIGKVPEQTKLPHLEYSA
jgi:ferredoxin, 2Fe-2S